MNTRDSENRLTSVQLAGGGLNPMSYRADGLHHQPADREGNRFMVWNESGSSGCVDLLDERRP